MPRQRGFDQLGAPRHMQLASRAGDAGVDELAREHAVGAGGQQQPDGIEFQAPGLVHGHGEGAAY